MNVGHAGNNMNDTEKNDVFNIDAMLDGLLENQSSDSMDAEAPSEGKHRAPKQKPGLSKQDYATPREFIRAVEKRLRSPFGFDLAADFDNCVTSAFFSEADDALKQPWDALLQTWKGYYWLNPPYADIEPWVKKCWTESRKGVSIAALLPASVGANWWRDWVEGKAYVNFLNGRLAFMPDKPKWLYPKDCALLLYNPWGMSGSEVWDWKKK